MPINAPVRNADGSVSAVVNGATMKFSPSDLAALQGAPPAAATEVRPLLITTGSGRQYGQNKTPRYGVFFNSMTGKWNFLDKYGVVIPNTSWKPRNLSRSKFKFNAGT